MAHELHDDHDLLAGWRHVLARGAPDRQGRHPRRVHVLFAVSGVFFTVNPLLTLTDPILSTGHRGRRPILPIVTINLLVAVSLTRNWMCCCEERMSRTCPAQSPLARVPHILWLHDRLLWLRWPRRHPLVPPVPIPAQYANLTTAELALISPAVDPGNAPGAAATALLLLFNCIFMKPAVRKGTAWLHRSQGRGACRRCRRGSRCGARPRRRSHASTFKGLPIDQLSEADFSTSGDTGLHEKTVKANAARCMASSRTRGMTRPRQVAGVGTWRPPRKPTARCRCSGSTRRASTSGGSTRASRRCPSTLRLPELLVVVGPTYTRRLWCVMVIRVFADGRLARPRHLLRCPEVQRELATFQAEQAQCFKAEDREHLLGIVESAFGDFAAFNQKVRGLFSKKSITMDNLPTAGSKGGSPAKYKVAQVAPAES